jgi:hypothetical protein
MTKFLFCFVIAISSLLSLLVPHVWAACLDPASVYGDIRRFYDEHYGLSTFGCATSDEYDYVGSRARNFAFGQIVWVPISDNKPIILGAYQDSYAGGQGIGVFWEDYSRRDFYQIRYQQDQHPEVQMDDIPGHERIKWIQPVFWPNSTFRIKLQGCDSGGFLASSNCYGWLPTLTVVTGPNTPTPPQPSPPPPQTTSPQLPGLPHIDVTRENNGGFTVDGDHFTARQTVNIRIVDNALQQLWKHETARDNGTFRLVLPNLCQLPGTLSFSANDGRPNKEDLTGTLWSNTVTISCP